MRRAILSAGLFRGATLLAVIPALTACYTFYPVDPEGVSPGDRIQLVLSGPATRSVPPAAMMGETLVQGNFMDMTEDSISVAVWIGEAYRVTPFEPVHQSYTFPRAELIRLESQQLSKSRTAFTAVGILAVIYVMIDRLELFEDPNPWENGERPPPPDSPFTFRYGEGRGLAPGNLRGFTIWQQRAPAWKGLMR